MGAVSQIIRPIEIGVQNVVQQTSNALTGALQPVEKAVNQAVTDVGKTIANSPGLEAAITAIAAAYNVPPSITAGFLAANKTSQTGGNLEKGLETLVLSYGAGKLMNPGAIDLSSPTAINQSVAQAQTAAQTQAAAEAQAQAAAQAQAQAAAQAQAQASAQAAAQAAAVPAATPIASIGAAAPAANVVGTPLGSIAAAAPAGANLSPAALESLTGQAGYGVNAAAQAAAPSLGVSPAAIGAGAGIGSLAIPSSAIPAAGISANEAVASGMGPGSAGAQMAATGGLTAEQLAAAAGTTGAGSALNALATAGNASALTDALNSGSSGLTGLLNSAGSAIGNTLGNLSGTQLAALGTGAAGLYNASATREAMQQAIAATQAANASSQGTLGNIYNQQLGYQAPYQAAGVGAVNQLAGMNPYLTHQFNAADLQAGLAPNYDFMLQQGQQANQRAANVGGGALGGNALTGLNQYTQNYAGNAYQNAFNNYQNQRTGIYNNLAGIANIGQAANTGAGTAGTNYGQGITNLNTSLANAQSANILGQAQVGAGGITNAANTAFLATLLGQNTPTAGTSQTGAAPAGGGTSISDFAKLLTGIKAFTG
jgi:hypothetical protein